MSTFDDDDILGEGLTLDGDQFERLDHNEESKEQFFNWCYDVERILDFEASNCSIEQHMMNSGASKVPLIVAEVFVYIPVDNSAAKLMSITDNQLSEYQYTNIKILPFAKILNSPIADQIGKIYTIPDNMCRIEYNPAHRTWLSQRAGKPSMDDGTDEADEVGPEPAKFISDIAMWNNYRYTVDKFKPRPDIVDTYTFLMPFNNLVGPYTPKSLDDSK